MATKTGLPLPKIVIAIIVLAILGIAGFFLLNKNKTATNAPDSSSGGVFSSIKDALSKSLSLQCEFTDEQGTKTKSYIKNGAVRADITATTAEGSGSVIVKDKKMWFWNEKGGFILEMSDDNVADTAKTGNKDSAGQNILKDLEQYKNQCKAAVVSDSLFTPPSNVTFTDMSKLIPSVPAGNTQNGGAPSEEEINKYLEQFKGTTGEPQQ